MPRALAPWTKIRKTSYYQEFRIPPPSIRRQLAEYRFFLAFDAQGQAPFIFEKSRPAPDGGEIGLFKRIYYERARMYTRSIKDLKQYDTLH